MENKKGNVSGSIGLWMWGLPYLHWPPRKCPLFSYSFYAMEDSQSSQNTSGEILSLMVDHDLLIITPRFLLVDSFALRRDNKKTTLFLRWFFLLCQSKVDWHREYTSEWSFSLHCCIDWITQRCLVQVEVNTLCKVEKNNPLSDRCLRSFHLLWWHS